MLPPRRLSAPRATCPGSCCGALFCLLGALAMLGGLVTSGLRWLPEGSQPRGFYWRSSLGEVERGMLVEACPPAEDWLTEYLAPGPCPGGLKPIVKTVVAMAGDRVEVRVDGVHINGEWQPGSTRAAADVPVVDGVFLLADDQVWLHSEHPRSLDSRVLGPISRSRLRARWKVL